MTNHQIFTQRELGEKYKDMTEIQKNKIRSYGFSPRGDYSKYITFDYDYSRKDLEDILRDEFGYKGLPKIKKDGLVDILVVTLLLKGVN